ncbi:TetR/AcrR family transcriptional regulator [Fredinandcohnia humi]
MLKRQLIMEKALELFAKQGFEATSVQQITEQCGISKGAFYLSFKSKDELILALIDHFMAQIISDVDHLVKNTIKSEKLLYEFYFLTFSSFQKHTDFAKILITEQSQFVNKELLLKTKYYDHLIDKNILSLIDRLYGEERISTKYDLLYSIKGFMRTYSELFLFYKLPIDMDLLCKSLVEKTNLLARQTTIPFINQELIDILNCPIHEEVSKEQLLKTIEQKLEEIEESIEKESLQLLKQHLTNPSLSPAIVKGLLENIRNHPHCKWITYQLRNYYQL